MLDWVLYVAWGLCAVQSLRICLGIIIDEFEGELFAVIFFGLLALFFSVLIGPAIVAMRGIYWAWHYYELENKFDGRVVKALVVQPEVESRSHKQSRKLREARNELAELRAQVNERH